MIKIDLPAIQVPSAGHMNTAAISCNSLRLIQRNCARDIRPYTLNHAHEYVKVMRRCTFEFLVSAMDKC